MRKRAPLSPLYPYQTQPKPDVVSRTPSETILVFGTRTEHSRSGSFPSSMRSSAAPRQVCGLPEAPPKILQGTAAFSTCPRTCRFSPCCPPESNLILGPPFPDVRQHLHDPFSHYKMPLSFAVTLQNTLWHALNACIIAPYATRRCHLFSRSSKISFRPP